MYGKSRKLGVSDTIPEDTKVIASWQKPKKDNSSWIVLTKE